MKRLGLILQERHERHFNSTPGRYPVNVGNQRQPFYILKYRRTKKVWLNHVVSGV